MNRTSLPFVFLFVCELFWKSVQVYLSSHLQMYTYHGHLCVRVQLYSHRFFTCLHTSFIVYCTHYNMSYSHSNSTSQQTIRLALTPSLDTNYDVLVFNLLVVGKLSN